METKMYNLREEELNQIIDGMSNLTVCIACGKYPLVFENTLWLSEVKNAEEWESDPDTGEKRCFKCHCEEYPNFPDEEI
jgi:hypothetical protein